MNYEEEQLEQCTAFLISEMAKDDPKGKVDVKSLTSKQYLDQVCIIFCHNWGQDLLSDLVVQIV